MEVADSELHKKHRLITVRSGGLGHGEKMEASITMRSECISRSYMISRGDTKVARDLGFPFI